MFYSQMYVLFNSFITATLQIKGEDLNTSRDESSYLKISMDTKDQELNVLKGKNRYYKLLDGDNKRYMRRR